MRRGFREAQPYTRTVLAHAVMIIAGLGALVVVCALVVLHRLRARWRAVRARADVRAGLSWISAWRNVGAGGGPARWRYELWQGVADATRALQGAETAAGGRIGELRSLNRRLRETAVELDRLLGMAAGMASTTPEVAELRRQVGDALAAASAIRRAALASASTTTGARAGELASDAAREVEVVTAGVERSRAALIRE